MTGEIIAAKATKEIATALNTALESPSKEIGNYIADKIRYLRYRSLLKIVKIAEEKARLEGMTLKMPALKFFIPFCESAALEEEDSDGEDHTSLREMWENLLISAADTPSGESLYHLNILKNIGKDEVSFLWSIMLDNRADIYFMPLCSWDATDARFLNKTSFNAAFNRLPSNFDPRQLTDVVVRCAECTGIMFEEVCFISDEADELSSDFSHERRDRRRVPASVLCALGVIEEFNFHSMPVGRWDPSLRFFADGYRVTTMGIRFFERCIGELPKQTMLFDIDENSDGIALVNIIKSRETTVSPTEDPSY